MPNVLLNTSPFLPHNTSGMLKSVLQKWGLTHLQDGELLAIKVRPQHVGSRLHEHSANLLRAAVVGDLLVQ
jgi:hypothetical protein